MHRSGSVPSSTYSVYETLGQLYKNIGHNPMCGSSQCVHTFFISLSQMRTVRFREDKLLEQDHHRQYVVKLGFEFGAV